MIVRGPEHPARARAWRLLFCMMMAAGSCDKVGNSRDEVLLGSRLSASGMISDTSLKFHFSPRTLKGTEKDFFNFIYFEGDTVCFSFSRREGEHVSVEGVEFIRSDRRYSCRVERLEIRESRIYGFSLVGSLLECFYRERLREAFEPGDWKNRDIPFILEISIKKNGVPMRRVLYSSFRISL